MSIIKLLDFKTVGDERGQLVAVEAMKNIPFEIKRIYYMTNMDNEKPRGFHAHKQLQQVAICLQGSCRFTMDNGAERSDVWLNLTNQGLVIDKMIWHELYDFSNDCILLLLASDFYDESDYIRNYSEFTEAVRHA